MEIEKVTLGSFSNKNDERVGKCHKRFWVDKKQNIMFSFDPVSMAEATKSAMRGRGRGTTGLRSFRSEFSANTSLFPGECVQIILIEDASLSELLQCWLDITKGKEIPPGSVVVIFSATHLLMEGLNGYVSDLVRELRRFDSIFEEGLFAIPGVLVFMEGCGSLELIRDLWDLMCWLKHIRKLDLKQGWCALMESFIGGGGGGGGKKRGTPRKK